MVRMSLPVGRRSLRGVASALALFAGVAVVSTGLTSTVAVAQKKEKAPTNSKGFATVYQPVATASNAEGADFNAIKAQIPAIVAAVENEADRFAAGNLVLITGNKLTDAALQRQGLELMVASGLSDPAQVPQFQFFIGNLAINAKDYTAARTALEAAKAGGYVDPNIDALIAESYFLSGGIPQGLAVLKDGIAKNTAAGQPVDTQWLLRGLAMAYESKDVGLSNEWSTMLVKHAPTDEHWISAIQVVQAVNQFDAQGELDLMRLMAATKTLREKREFVAYIEAADPRIMANEVQRVLLAGTQAGVFNAADQYYVDVKRVVDPRLAGERAEAASLAKDAQASGSANDAQNAGDVFLSVADYAQAEAMYKLAVEKGADAGRNLTRLGMVQLEQGKTAEALEAFNKVSGARAPIAQLWASYASSKG